MRRPLLALLLAVPAAAQDAERALLVVDPDQAESRYVANYYLAARGLPQRNVLYMDPAAAGYVDWTDVQRPGFLGALRNAGIEDTVDFVVLPPGERFFVPAAGLVSDSCFAVKRFATPASFTLARQAEDILDGINVNDANHYETNGWGPRAFQSRVGWFLGDESTGANAESYFLGAMLGWTGQNGNTLQEVLDMIDRSVAADGTQPAGTFYFCQTNDQARSGPRHDTYPAAVSQITSKGGAAQHLMANLPIGSHDALGVMTGLANPAITDPNFSLLPGAFADHLTSYAATFDNNSQTKMSRWITKGASGTAGTVEEPCNYSGKFPHARLHVTYFRGLTLGEAWLRSHGFKPFQSLLLGDPLTRPFAKSPTVDVPAPPVGPQSGTITITPDATAQGGSNSIVEMTLFVDGRPVEEIAAGSFTLDTTTLADGWHELRVRAVDAKIQRFQATWTGALEVDNFGRAVTLTTSGATSGDLGTLFTLDHAASGAAVAEVVLLQHERVVGASDQAGGSVALFGQNLGAGPVRLQAEARFLDGRAARSAPLDLDVAYLGGGAAQAPPVAFDFTVRVREDEAFVLALPGAFDDDPSTVPATLTGLPAQSTVLGGEGSWRVLRPAPDAVSSDTLTYTLTSAWGTSNTGTVTIEYVDVDGCQPTHTYCVGAPNSAGPGASISNSGSVSVAANDLVLHVDGAPAGQFGLFFYGPGKQLTPLGDGWLCVGGNLGRFPVTKTDVAGTASQVVDNTATPGGGGAITSGSSYAFQFWYRDPAAGGAGYNLSDGLGATFCD